MPANEFNIGRDISMDIQDPDRGIVRFSIRTGVEWTPQYNNLESKGLDGIPRKDNVPNGHRLVFTFDRADRRIDDYFVNREATYFNGGTVPLVTFTETIKERDGSISQYRYTGVSLSLTSGGVWRGDAITTQSIEAMAARKIRIG